MSYVRVTDLIHKEDGDNKSSVETWLHDKPNELTIEIRAEDCWYLLMNMIENTEESPEQSLLLQQLDQCCDAFAAYVKTISNS